MPSELMQPETMGFLERAVRDPAIDVEKLETILALQERVLAFEAKRQYAEAMNECQRDMPQVVKDALSQNRRYSSYEAIDAVIRAHYTAHGFSVTFRTACANNRIRVTCVVKHRGGHEEAEYELESGPDMSGARGSMTRTEVQGVGSTVTYLKRYTLCAAFAVAVKDDETDDDGARGGRRDDSMRGSVEYQPRVTEPVRNTPPADGNGFKFSEWFQSTSVFLENCKTLAEVDAVEQETLTQRVLTKGNDAQRLKTHSIIQAARQQIMARDRQAAEGGE